jgi:hypothetical protein
LSASSGKRRENDKKGKMLKNQKVGKTFKVAKSEQEYRINLSLKQSSLATLKINLV